MYLSVLEVIVLYGLNVLQFQTKVDLCNDKLDCVKKVLHHGLLNE